MPVQEHGNKEKPTLSLLFLLLLKLRPETTVYIHVAVSHMTQSEPKKCLLSTN